MKGMKYLVMSQQDFELEPSPENRFQLPLPVVVDKGKMVGYLPIYNTMEDALADFPESTIALIEEVKDEHIY